MITELTNVNLIKGNLQANNKKEVFEELAKMLFENNRISSKEAFLTDIEARETLSVTSMDGIAYPHAKRQSGDRACDRFWRKARRHRVWRRRGSQTDCILHDCLTR